MDLRSTAVVFESPRVVSLREIELPQPDDEDIIIENVYTGISVGTEGWILRGERPVDSKFPCVPGYQQSGVVSWTGSKVDRFKVGDRVNCWNTKLPPDLNYGWAGHVSRSVQNHRMAAKVPDGVSLKGASLAKLFAVGYHGVELTEIQEGDLVAVLGLGVIGQGYAQIARTRGAKVVGADLAQYRVDIAAKYSCDAAVGAGEFGEAIRRFKEDGADVVVDTTGKTDIMDYLVKFVRVRGKMVWQGWYPGRVSFDFHPVHLKRAKMIFPCSFEGEDVVLDMLAADQLVIEPLISHVFDAADAPKAYELMLGSPQDFLGITLKWRDE